MATFSSSPAWLCIGGRRHQETEAKHGLNGIQANVAAGRSLPSKVDFLTHDHSQTDIHTTTLMKQEARRQNIPTEKQLVDSYRHGMIVDDGVVYRQTVVIRSYEVGPDKTATIQTVFSLLQETALNHVWMSGLLSDGFGATHGMMRNNLIWVVSRIHLQLDHYPIWGEIVEIDTWVGASGKNGMRRDWLLRSRATGLAFARATSTWVMMNQTTRRLSKMPDEVRAEISPWFTQKQAVEEECHERIETLDNNAAYVLSNLKPKRSDLDMNNHVNNINYVKWMLETIPDELVENHKLCSIILEYRRECGSSDLVQSLCEPAAGRPRKINGTDGRLGSAVSYTHLLQITGGGGGNGKDEEILRGKTTWNKKIQA